MKVYIPSQGRADERLLRGPAVQMSPYWEPTYVVPSEEVPSYQSNMARHQIRAELVGCPVSGIAATRYWIGLRALRQGAEKFVMVDDDVGFLVRRAEDTWQLRAAEVPEVDSMLCWVQKQLDKHQHVSISAREGNNRAGVGSVHTLVDHNTRTLRVLAYQTQAHVRCNHLRVSVMEDFDIALQLLEKGGSIAVSYWWAQGQRMTNESGGCSVYRSHEVHEDSARSLATLHPGLVSLRQKSNKTDRDGFGTRTEVTIQWKLAHKLGQQRLLEGKSVGAAGTFQA